MSTTFHYTKETPTEATFAEIQTLNKFNDEQFAQLATIVITFLSEPCKTTVMMDQLSQFAEEQGINVSSLKLVVKSLLVVLRSCLKLNLDSSMIKDDLLGLGLGEDKSNYFSERLSENHAAMSKGMLSQTLMVNQLVDMEWKFGVTAASSELSKVGSTFLQLKLVINKGHTMENVYMELTLPQFYSFLHEMEKAKSSLEYLS